MRIIFAILIIAISSLKAYTSEDNITYNRKKFIEGLSYLSNDNYKDAESSFRMLIDKYEYIPEYPHYFLILTLNRSKRYEEAVNLGERFLSRYKKSPLIPDVEYEIGKGYYNLNVYKRAEEHLIKALLDEFIDREKPKIYFMLAKILDKLNEDKKAIHIYQLIREKYPKDSYAKLAKGEMYNLISIDKLDEESLLKEGDLLFNEGDFYGAINILNRIKGDYHPQALLKLFKAYIKIGRFKKAIKTLKKLITEYHNSKESLEGLYELGLYYWNIDNNSKAIMIMKRVVSNSKEGEYAIKGMYVIGRILEEEGKYKKAIAYYMRLINRFPKNKFYDESIWRIGWIYYLSGDYKKSYEYFTKGISAHSLYELQSLYWAGRTMEKSGNINKAVEMYTEVMKRKQDGYYGYMANKRLIKFGKFEKSLSSKKDIENIEKKAKLSIEDIKLLNRIKEVINLKLNYLLDRELKYIHNDNPLLLYNIGHILNEAKEYYNSIIFAIKASELSYNSEDLYKIKYPLGYWNYIKKYAKINNFSPFIVAGLIRQESLYDPESISRSNAIGLMQIIPSTGSRIASELGIDNFDETILKEPETNISFGIYYLSELLNRFNGDLIMTIAGYNAGENRVDSWWNRIKFNNMEQDEIIEMIPYKETRDYVKLVLRNIKNYKIIWRDEYDKYRKEREENKGFEKDNK
jgi:soluble lytic murein transglycosylase